MSDSNSILDGQGQTQALIREGNYPAAIAAYETTIALQPHPSHYWHLGLLYLAQGQPSQFKASLLQGLTDEASLLSLTLLEEWEPEQLPQEWLREAAIALLTRQPISLALPPTATHSLVLLLLATEFDQMIPEQLEYLGILSELRSGQSSIHPDLLLALLDALLTHALTHPLTVEFIEACLPYFPQPQAVIDHIMLQAIALSATQAKVAVKLAECCRQLAPDDPQILSHLASFYQDAGNYDRGVDSAKHLRSLAQTPMEQIAANHLMLRGLMRMPDRWQEAGEVLQQQAHLLAHLDTTPVEADSMSTLQLITAGFFFPYGRDDLRQNRALQNQLGQLCQSQFQRHAPERVKQYQRPVPQSARDRPLKIGYLSSCLNRHSVGWLARSLFQYHDHDRFQIHGYFLGNQQSDFLHSWYVNQVDLAYQAKSVSLEDTLKLADQIAQDEIDILIELDSITLDLSCHIVALKPAPIQVTWLGWDASGIPAVDYFIADPYVLPDWAEDHYREKLWRLPQSYIGLDGFEVAIPSLHRQDLDIPQDALVYYCVQNSYKRHPAISRRQIQVLRQVPNSHLLIKGIADETTLKRFFLNLAEEEGVDPERLHFLQGFATEAMHRASLRLADVVLDTYPYNGATTTLETLWMEVPLVTRVGEHFSSRNSYTMLKNVGVEEGIAWSDDEYVDWAVRFGTDSLLRQQVAWKLRQAKHNAPLWNGKQFTRHMEQAYEQMWAIHLEKAFVER